MKKATTIPVNNNDAAANGTGNFVRGREIPTAKQTPEQKQPKQVPAPQWRRTRRAEAKMTFLDPPQYATSMVVLGNAPKLIGEKPMKSNPQEQGSANKDQSRFSSATTAPSPQSISTKGGYATEDSDGERARDDVLSHFSTETTRKQRAGSGVTPVQDASETSQRPSTASLKVMAALGLDFCVSDVDVGEPSRDHLEEEVSTAMSQAQREKSHGSRCNEHDDTTSVKTRGSNSAINFDKHKEDTANCDLNRHGKVDESSDDEEADERGENTNARVKTEVEVTMGAGSKSQLKNARSFRSKDRLGVAVEVQSVFSVSSTSRQTSADPRGAHLATRDNTSCVSRVDAPSVSPFSEISRAQSAKQEDDVRSQISRVQSTKQEDDVRSQISRVQSTKQEDDVRSQISRVQSTKQEDDVRSQISRVQSTKQEDDVRSQISGVQSTKQEDDVRSQISQAKSVKQEVDTESVGCRGDTGPWPEAEEEVQEEEDDIRAGEDVERQTQQTIGDSSAIPLGSVEHPGTRSRSNGSRKMVSSGGSKSSPLSKPHTPELQAETDMVSAKDKHSAKVGDFERGVNDEVDSKRNSAALRSPAIEKAKDKDSESMIDNRSQRSAANSHRSDRESARSRRSSKTPAERAETESSSHRGSARSRRSSTKLAEQAGTQDSAMVHSASTQESRRSIPAVAVDLEADAEGTRSLPVDEHQEASSSAKSPRGISKQDEGAVKERDNGELSVDKVSKSHTPGVHVVDLEPGLDGQEDPQGTGDHETHESSASALGEELSRGREKLHKVSPRDLKPGKGRRPRNMKVTDVPDGSSKHGPMSPSSESDESHADSDFDSFGSNDLLLFKQAEKGEDVVPVNFESAPAHEQGQQEEQLQQQPLGELSQAQQESLQGPEPRAAPSYRESQENLVDEPRESQQQQQHEPEDPNNSMTPTFPIGVDSRRHLGLGMATFPHRSRPISRSATDIRTRGGEPMRSLDYESVTVNDVRGRRLRPRTTQAIGTKRGALWVSGGCYWGDVCVCVCVWGGARGDCRSI